MSSSEAVPDDLKASSESEALARAMSALPEAEKLLVNAVYFEGSEPEDVAGQLGLAPEDFDELHQRAMLRLGRAIEDAEPDRAHEATPDKDVERLGRAAKGSARGMQEWVERGQEPLWAALSATPSLREFATGPCEWLSPLRESLYREFRDDLWSAAGLPGPTPQEDEFWPRKGPKWDAVALVPGRDEQGLILVEAKSHVAEMQSHCGATSPSSVKLIGDAFADAKEALGADPNADWLSPYYQAANRLTFLWYLRGRGIPTWLVHLYFVGDRFSSGGQEVVGPASDGEWMAAVSHVKQTLGLSDPHPLSAYAIDLCLPASPPRI